MARKYEMAGRTASMQRTREEILDAVVSLSESWYDEVTLGDVARRAGVSQQTVVNHFGSKMNLYVTAIRERYAPEVKELRRSARPGDAASVVDAVMSDYEVTGDRTWRLVCLAGRMEELRPVVAGGRRAHREFVEHAFAPVLPRRGSRSRERLVTLVAVALDVTTWHQLRRDTGLSRAETGEHVLQLVRALLPSA